MDSDRQHADLIGALPSYISVSHMLKATPATEGGERFIYLEASNESLDQQGEVVLAKALADSADYYLKFGNIDLDHITQLGARAGIRNPESYEIGRPIDVRIDGTRTFVKGHIHAGAGVAAEKANLFWSSLTEITPPARWYPSVGGAVTGKDVMVDPLTKARRAVINKVRWANIGFSKTPVNANLATVSTSAFGPLAKSWDLGACVKSLTVGHVTDSAQLTGGGALRTQSLDHGVMSYWDFKDRFAEMATKGELAGMKLPALVTAAQSRFGVPAADAAEYVERFLDDLQRGLREKKR